MDRSAADIQDITVEEGLEPPYPMSPVGICSRTSAALNGGALLIQKCKNNGQHGEVGADGGALHGLRHVRDGRVWEFDVLHPT